VQRLWLSTERVDAELLPGGVFVQATGDRAHWQPPGCFFVGVHEKIGPQNISQRVQYQFLIKWSMHVGSSGSFPFGKAEGIAAASNL
jgi:hypothetical protein